MAAQPMQARPQAPTSGLFTHRLSGRSVEHVVEPVVDDSRRESEVPSLAVFAPAGFGLDRIHPKVCNRFDRHTFTLLDDSIYRI